MKTEIPGVDWYLDCQPRVVQLEALARSYTGMAYREHKDDEQSPEPLDHFQQGPARGWGHFMEMRLGKTPTALNESEMFRLDHGVNKLFVLSPNQYKYTWGAEATKFGLLRPTFIFESKKRKEFQKFMDTVRGGDSMVVVHYEALGSEDNYKLFLQYVDSKTMIVDDESVLLKNRESMFFKRAFELYKQAAVSRPLTGKPTPQGVTDLYSQLKLCEALNGWDFFQFRGVFAQLGGFKGKQIKDVKNEDRLAKIRRQHSFFARRKDWGHNIDSDYETIELEMTEEQKKAYFTMEEEFMVWLESGAEVTADQIITKHMKLQQIVSGFIFDEFKDVHWFLPFKKTAKWQALVDRLENQTTDKAIVIFNYGPTGDALYEALQPFGVAAIRGKQWMKEKGIVTDEEKHRFNNDPKCRIMLGQSTAIKYGHTLMGTQEDPCLTTFYFENNYSSDDRSQTEQRNQGEGQLDAINIVDFVSSPIERKITEALQRKEEIASRIMGYYKGEK